MERGVWWARVHGIAKPDRFKRLTFTFFTFTATHRMEAGILRGGGDGVSVSEGPESRLAAFRFCRGALLMKQHFCPGAGDRDSHAPESPAVRPGVPRARAPSRLIEALSGPGVGLSRGKSHPVLFSSVAQSRPTLCDPMDCSTPGLPVHHQLPEFTQTHVHRVHDAIQPFHPLSSPSPAFNLSQHQGLFK